jgi:uridine kinase
VGKPVYHLPTLGNAVLIARRYKIERMSSFVIGVAGGSGSGKTTVVRRIVDSLGPEHVTLLDHDRYYRDRNDLRLEVRAGRQVEVPRYDFTRHARLAEKDSFQPRRALIVEGILIFTDAALRDLMDIKVFVDTDSDTRFIRRLQRDVAERGRTMESVIDQYQTTVKPMHLEFVEPSKRYADVIIPLGGHNTVAVDLLLTMLRSVSGRRD